MSEEPEPRNADESSSNKNDSRDFDMSAAQPTVKSNAEESESMPADENMEEQPPHMRFNEDSEDNVISTSVKQQQQPLVPSRSCNGSSAKGT